MEKQFIIVLIGFLLLTGCQTNDRKSTIEIGAIEFSSDYEPLNAGFQWAKEQSLAYVFEGDSVGDWFEASLPGRDAFCMRDVSHQAYGALAMGLHGHLKNMLYKFASNISKSKDWCSYWEISKNNRPAPVDYTNDDDFWYNLPANFDVVAACHRVFEWTADGVYLFSKPFNYFYFHSLTSYIDAWDEDGDGLMESPASNGRRGIPTYWEGVGPKAYTGGDLVAAQYAAALAYSRILYLQGEKSSSYVFGQKAFQLKSYYNDKWWDKDNLRFYTSILEDGSFDTTYIPSMQIFPLYFDIINDEPRKDSLLISLKKGYNVEENSYLPEVYYMNDYYEEGFGYLMQQFDPELSRREYPENPFTAIGTITRYLAGITPQASNNIVEIRPQLPKEVSWIKIDNVPVLKSSISVEYKKDSLMVISNHGGRTLNCMVILPGEIPSVDIDGETFAPQVQYTKRGQLESAILVPVGKANTVRIAVNGK